MRRYLSVTAAVALVAAILGTAAPAKATTPTFLTLLLGRTQEYPTATPTCQPLPNTIDLDQAAATLHALGVNATGAVIVDRTAPTATTCVESDAYPSWSHLAQLTAQDDMTFISAGVDYEDNTLLSEPQAEANICGSLSAFTAHGDTSAWGLFAYPNNKQTVELQTDVTSDCFAFGRQYGDKQTANPAASPYLQHTASITAGACNNPALACYNLTTLSGPQNNNTPTHYWSLPSLEQLMTPAAGTWGTVQMYKFVTDSYRPGATSGPSWDCTSPDWTDHYSSIAETYCWNDFMAAIAQIGSAVTVTDPASVARAWGEVPAPPIASFTSAKQSGSSETISFASTVGRSWFECGLDGAPMTPCSSPAAFTGLAAGKHVFNVYATDAFGDRSPTIWKVWVTG